MQNMGNQIIGVAPNILARSNKKSYFYKHEYFSNAAINSFCTYEICIKFNLVNYFCNLGTKNNCHCLFSMPYSFSICLAHLTTLSLACCYNLKSSLHLTCRFPFYIFAMVSFSKFKSYAFSCLATQCTLA